MKSQSTKTRTLKFAIVGTILAIANFAIYTFLARVIMSNNELLWLDSLISYLLATFLAYLMHSKITWRERHPTKVGVIKFFLWNFITALAISPFFTWLFTLLTPLYEFTFGITSAIHLPFDFNFVESTGVFVLTTCVTMILNYLFYDKLVFGNHTAPQNFPLAQSNIYKVSIIVPIYNTAHYLPACLDSIICQSYSNLEILLIDDGSTDNSGTIADEYAKKDPRIQVFHQSNQGQSAARNFGLKQSTGDFVSFIDSDDKINKNFISKLLAPYEDDNISLTVCGMHYKRLKNHSSANVYITPLRPRRKHESKKAYILYLLTTDGRMYSSVNKLYRTTDAKKCHFAQNLYFAEDTKFVLDYLQHSKGTLRFVTEPLYTYNFGTDSSTINRTATNWRNWQIAYQNLKKWLGTNPNLSEKLWLHLIHLRWRISYLRSTRRAKQAK